MRLGRRRGLVEDLLLAPDPADEHREAEHEQQVAQDRADDRGLHDLLKSLGEEEEGDDQLGGVAEGDVEEAADARPGLRCQLLGREAHQRRRRDDPRGRAEEDDRRVRVEDELEQDREQDERRQEVRPALR